MPKDRFILSIDHEYSDMLTKEAKKMGISKNLLAVQIIRKHFNSPSILNEG